MTLLSDVVMAQLHLCNFVQRHKERNKKKNHINRWVEVSLLEYKVPRNRRVLLDSAKWKSVISAHKYLCSQIKNVNTF